VLGGLLWNTVIWTDIWIAEDGDSLWTDGVLGVMFYKDFGGGPDHFYEKLYILSWTMGRLEKVGLGILFVDVAKVVVIIMLA
jgi:hypothetical protein